MSKIQPKTFHYNTGVVNYRSRKTQHTIVAPLLGDEEKNVCIFVCIEVGGLLLLPRYEFNFCMGECSDINNRKVFEHPHFIQHIKLYFLLNFCIL